MKTIDLYENKSNFNEVVDEAVKVLKNGGVFAYPTDTVYGFGCDATNAKAVKKINTIKKREEKAFSVIVRDLKMINEYVYLSKKDEKIIDKVLPGPFTLIFNGRENLPLDVTGKKRSLGIRIPDYSFTKAISEQFDKPYVTTSVNLSGEPPLVVGVDIRVKFEKNEEKPDLIVDAGRLGSRDEVPEPSTVVDLTGGKPSILRCGGLNVVDIIGLVEELRESDN